jgi:acetolactate synthase small subunit
MWIEVRDVVLHQALAQDDRVLEVVALPGHEGDEQVLAQRHLAVLGARTIGDDRADLDALTGA